MNQTELERLESPLLSHISRSLYAFYLHKMATTKQSLNLPEMANFLSNQSRFFPTQANLEVVKLCLTELEDLGLIKRSLAHCPWAQANIEFPLADKELEELPTKPFLMTKNWKPSPSFRDAALMVGLENCEYSQAELSEFISFWRSRQDMRNQISWERAFAIKLRRNRQAQRVRFKPKAQSPQSDNNLTKAPMAQKGSFDRPAEANSESLFK